MPKTKPDPIPCQGETFPSLYQAAVALWQAIVERGGIVNVVSQPESYRCPEGHWHNRVRWRRNADHA